MNILENSKEFFSSMTDEEFEAILKEFDFNYKKCKPGEGGIVYKGKVYKTYEAYEKAWLLDNSKRV